MLKMIQQFLKKTKLRKSFGLIVDGLNIKRCEISKEHSDLIINEIKTFEKHRSILKIKKLISGSCRLSFENVSLEDIKKVTQEVDISRTSQFLDIPSNIIKENVDIFSEFFYVSILIILLELVSFRSS